MIGLEPAKAGLAGALDTSAPGVVGIDLAHQEHLMAKARQGFADQGFGSAVAIHFGGVDQAQAEFDAGAKRCDLLLAQAGVLAMRQVP